VTSTSHEANEYVRRGLLKIDETTVLAAVDSLNLRGASKVSAVVGLPLRTLQQRRDVAAFCAGAPIAAVRALLELLAVTPLERIIAALGDHADTPTYEQMVAAVDHLVADGATVDEIVAVLAFAIGEEFPAAPHCRRVLDERLEFELPELPDVASTGSLLDMKEIDPEVRNQRRARREAERVSRQQRKKSVPSRPPRPAKVKAVTAKLDQSPAPKPAEPVAGSGRRQLTLTPSEAGAFATAHPLVGAVVLVEIPFDSVDPATPELHSKERPALVVGVSANELLVRGIYSNPSPARLLFTPWRRLGLDHVSFVDSARNAIARTDVIEFGSLGRLSDDEWNQTL